MLESQRAYGTPPTATWILILICVIGSNCAPVKEIAHVGVSRTGNKDSTHTESVVVSSLGSSSRSRDSKQPDDDLERLIKEIFREGYSTERASASMDEQLVDTQVAILDIHKGEKGANLEDPRPLAPNSGMQGHSKGPSLPANNFRDSNVSKVGDLNISADLRVNRTNVYRGTEDHAGYDRIGAKGEATVEVSGKKTDCMEREEYGFFVPNGTRRVDTSRSAADKSPCEMRSPSARGDEVWFPKDDGGVSEGEGEEGQREDYDTSALPFFITNVPRRCAQGEKFLRGRCRTFRP